LRQPNFAFARRKIQANVIGFVVMNEAIIQAIKGRPESMYNPEEEHDSCGVGFVAAISGQRSNRILHQGLTAVCNMAHRGAIDADAKTGDGSGVLTQIPYKLFRKEVTKLGHTLYDDSDLAVGVLFLPHDNAYAQAHAKAIVEDVLEFRQLFLFGWREVPVNSMVLGDKARLTMPRIEQVLIGRPAGMNDDEYERRLFLARNEIEKRAHLDHIRNFYIVSFSHRVIIYKGLLTAASLEKFYRDLANPDYETAICVYHERYSTNTFPTWPLSQPFRFLAHNGEINTIRGNRNWMRARESELMADFWGKDVDLLKPIIQPGGSDSASLDNALEVLTMSGRGLLHSMNMLVPPAWRTDETMTAELKAYYEYHRCFNEPWDGPAGLVFSDGIIVAACLDRNGLRPARYKITDDGIVVMGSEVGCLELDDAHVVEKGRLAPGEMIAIDTRAGKLLRDAKIKQQLSTERPYLEWVNTHLLRLQPIAGSEVAEPKEDVDILGLTQQQIAFGYSSEELDMVLKPMVKDGQEAVGSMGDDTPLAVLSKQPRLLYTYFKQLFAQVTNPPIDPLRERLVMSLATQMGWRRNLLGETPEHAKLVHSDSPILLQHEMAALRSIPDAAYKSATFSVLWNESEGEEGLERAVNQLCIEVEHAVDEATPLIILTDKGVDANHLAIPMLLATGAVHHHLIRVGKRMKCSLICETGEAREVHQMACLISYGASAVYPYLGYATVRELLEKGALGDGATYPKAIRKYQQALEKGLLKIMSKMGISVIGSYRGAQIFEAIGINSDLIIKCFAGTPSKIDGIGFAEIARETLTRHHLAFAGPTPQENGMIELSDPGYYRFRRQGEQHAITPPVIKNFHTFVKSNKPEDYKAYVEAVRAVRPNTLRDLLERTSTGRAAIPIEEVEPIEEIRKRFTTAGMSLGALSPEAHECLAIAMNQIGGKSNSGEGGEDPERFHRRKNGDWPNSAIKQIAQGRFGVTAAYLAASKEIEIKMAQGAKPGEGGQLPGHKVTELIARLRKSTPGVTLISPPPHHDIYSIEDLAQLIYDLKQVNPRAKVCVKLVAEAGIGTVAAGVAKAHADIVLISGHEGGTGASPLSSIKNAGSAWELGVAEAHQVLLLNGLRNRVTLRTDGGMRTGEDIVFAALLGAEEFNFGTTALIASGCVYVRQCHLNTCPVGIATQDERLRAKFKGKPENVVNYFNSVAQEVRELMAGMGIANFNELVGRVEYLRQRKVDGHPKANTVNLSRLLVNVAKDDESQPRHNTWERNDPPQGSRLDDTILQDARDAVNDRIPLTLAYRVKSTNRAVGTKLSGEIGYLWGEKGLPDGTIELSLRGSAGQSFGAFLSPGVNISLVGEANDYVGKGMGGGEIVVRPSANRKFVAHENSIVGNTCLYGATGGSFFAAGRAGERFAVRNSGATAVIEGIGDHGCEYMTGGTVVVLGKTGKNFGAGMTGGTAYVLDLDGTFSISLNPELVTSERLGSEADILRVKELVYKHLERTESDRAKEILADWGQFQQRFWRIRPIAVAPISKPVVASSVENVPAP
jgi:glutamate synthase domain-containing protein 2/glutamate synthase domain-containing protein 1/glutamate synthase domain-containing protein 3